MASSRSMRNSPRTASPMDVAMKNSIIPENTSHIQKDRLSLAEGWTEPPLRTPAPSFEDYKGLERGGVLEHMAPLGSLPNQKVKLRVKHYEPGRRYVQSKLGEGAVITKEAGKETVKEPQAARRRSEAHRNEDHSSKVVALQERDEDQDYTPKGAAAKSLPTKPTPSRSLLPETPSSRTNVGQERLRQVVESAVERSRELGNETLGLAIRKLFEESLHNQTLADLLDAVLSQRPTPRQAADFQAYIKVARKQIKAENSTSRRSSNAAVASSSKSVSNSPSKPVKPTGAISNGTHRQTPPSTRTTQHPCQQMTTRGQTKEANGSAGPDEEHPSKRMKRTKSMSSTSSLSSLDSNDPSMELEASNSTGVQPLSHSDASFKGRASLGPKLHTFSTVKYANAATNKRLPQTAGQATDDSTTETAAKRRKLQMNFDDYSVQDSSIRPSPSPRHLDGIPLPIMTGPSPLSSSKLQSRLHSSDSRTAQMDEHEGLRSPGSSIHGDFLVPPPPGAQHVSRGVTPTQLGRPPKPVRRAARVKISPMKKKSGITAGFGRTSGGRDSPVGYLDENGDSDNVDYCTACSGNGQLLCCDGCTRSFHFTCLDPPMNPNHPPEGEWYCHICVSRRDPQPKPPRGLFSTLLALLEKKNPVAFNLPEDIRDYFECVKTGEEGEYEESTTLKSKSRSGFDEVPDYFKLKDSKGAFVLCYKCGKSSMGHREIIACDFCSLRWHLDCLDPPLANPPVRLDLLKPRHDMSKPRYSWMCPNHIDAELLAISTETKAIAETQAGGARMHKIRRPKNARIVDTALRRGFRNNGIIEIENEPTDDDEEEMEREEFGVVYRLPERGIKLDFIDRVKRSHYDTTQRQQQSIRARDERKRRVAAAAAKAQREAFDKRPLAERQAAFNLAQFSRSNPDIAIDPDQVTNLIGTLITEAPNNVLALSNEDSKPAENATKRNSSIPPTPPSSDQQEHVVGSKEREFLLMVQELVRRRLAISDATEI